MRPRLLTLPSDTFVICVSVVLLQFRFCVLDHKMIFVGLSQRLRNHGPDLHTSEADHGETFTTVDNFSSGGRSLILKPTIVVSTGQVDQVSLKNIRQSSQRKTKNTAYREIM